MELKCYRLCGFISRSKHIYIVGNGSTVKIQIIDFKGNSFSSNITGKMTSEHLGKLLVFNLLCFGFGFAAPHSPCLFLEELFVSSQTMIKSDICA